MHSQIARLIILLGLFFPAFASAGTVVEFYNTNLDNYFITSDSSEASQIDHGSAGPGWIRTGNTFSSSGTMPVCRFYGSQSPGPNSHFYTVDEGECEYLKQLQASTPSTEKRWNYEGIAFNLTMPTNGICSSGTVPIYRAYNNGSSRGIDSNHRITANLTAIQQVQSRGWNSEGVVMCAQSATSVPTTAAFSGTWSGSYNGTTITYAVIQTGSNLTATRTSPQLAGLTYSGVVNGDAAAVTVYIYGTRLGTMTWTILSGTTIRAVVTNCFPVPGYACGATNGAVMNLTRLY